VSGGWRDNPVARWPVAPPGDGQRSPGRLWVLYGTQELAGDTQARWRLTHLLPGDDPQQGVGLPASVAVSGIRCDEWFARWQDAKRSRRSRVRINNKRGARTPRRPVIGPTGRSGGRGPLAPSFRTSLPVRAPLQLDQRHFASGGLACRRLVGGVVEQLKMGSRTFRFAFAYPLRGTPASVGVTVGRSDHKGRV
jgi:hypothetical protein